MRPRDSCSRSYEWGTWRALSSPCGIGLELAHFARPAWLSTRVFWQTLPVTLEHEDQAEEFRRPPAAPQAEPPKVPPREVGGRQGPEPTRYGDWEVRGRCIDF
jgi:hypothetical protein